MHKNEPKGGFMLYHLKDTNKVVGTKQCIKAIQNDKVKAVFIAKDAEERVTNQVLQLAKEKQVPIEYVETMKELGSLCNIEVKTAIAAIIE